MTCLEGVGLAVLLAVMGGCTPAASPPTGPATNAPPTVKERDPAGARDGGARPGTADESPAAPSFTEEQAREVCATVIRKTRACKDLYLPALLRTRARFDRPPGIAKRYQTDGEEKLLPIASKEFDQDFSEEGIDARCGALLKKPKAARDWVVAREQSCLPTADDCAAFVECNMGLLAKKWGPDAKENDAGPRLR